MDTILALARTEFKVTWPDAYGPRIIIRASDNRSEAVQLVQRVVNRIPTREPQPACLKQLYRCIHAPRLVRDSVEHERFVDAQTISRAK